MPARLAAHGCDLGIRNRGALRRAAGPFEKPRLQSGDHGGTGRIGAQIEQHRAKAAFGMDQLPAPVKHHEQPRLARAQPRIPGQSPSR